MNPLPLFNRIKAVTLIGLSLLLQGCTLFGVGEAQYACPEPGKGVCKSARQIYEDQQQPISDSASQPNQTSRDETSVSSNQHSIIPEPVAQRLPAQLLRIWIAPWVDKQGNWHSDSVVLTDINPRSWHTLPVTDSPSP